MLSLTKGQKLDLTKGTSLQKLTIGLGWDAKSANSNGSAAYDLDASAILLDANRKILAGDDQANTIFFNHLKHATGAVTHSGDNLTGDGDGDDEQIAVDLSLIPADCNEVVFVVNIYEAASRSQNFGQVRNASIRAFNTETNEELLKYDLSEDYSGFTGVIMGSIYRTGTDWKFQAVGEGRSGTLNDIIAAY